MAHVLKSAISRYSAPCRLHLHDIAESFSRNSSCSLLMASQSEGSEVDISRSERPNRQGSEAQDYDEQMLAEEEREGRDERQPRIRETSHSATRARMLEDERKARRTEQNRVNQQNYRKLSGSIS